MTGLAVLFVSFILIGTGFVLYKFFKANENNFNKLASI